MCAWVCLCVCVCMLSPVSCELWIQYHSICDMIQLAAHTQLEQCCMCKRNECNHFAVIWKLERPNRVHLISMKMKMWMNNNKSNVFGAQSTEQFMMTYLNWKWHCMHSDHFPFVMNFQKSLRLILSHQLQFIIIIALGNYQNSNLESNPCLLFEWISQFESPHNFEWMAELIGLRFKWYYWLYFIICMLEIE